MTIIDPVALARRDKARRYLARLATPSNAAARSWYRIRNDGGAATVYLYSDIGEWSITADDFARDLGAITASRIDLRVSSRGGDVFDAVAIFESLKRHQAYVHAHVDGVAASAASFIVQAANKITMSPYGTVMIHDANGLCLGNAEDMRQHASVLDKVSDMIATVYRDRAGGTAAEWRRRMKSETWYSAQEAVDAGLADEVASAAPADPEWAATAARLTAPASASWQPPGWSTPTVSDAEWATFTRRLTGGR